MFTIECLLTFSPQELIKGVMVDFKTVVKKTTLKLANGEIYDGEVVKSKPDGIGRSFDVVNKFQYIGFWKKGKPHGQGIFINIGKNVFVGEYYYGKKHGEGEFVINNEFIYSYLGTWKHDELTCDGHIVYQDKSRYKGDILNYQRHGHGSFIFADGSQYTGLWINNKRKGKGKLFKPNGMIIICRWNDDKAFGPFDIKISESQLFRGHLTSVDPLNGNGVLFTFDPKITTTSKYVGEINHGKKHGAGIYMDQFGDKYYGTWINDKKNGVFNMHAKARDTIFIILYHEDVIVKIIKNL